MARVSNSRNSATHGSVEELSRKSQQLLAMMDRLAQTAPESIECVRQGVEDCRLIHNLIAMFEW